MVNGKMLVYMTKDWEDPSFLSAHPLLCNLGRTVQKNTCKNVSAQTAPPSDQYSAGQVGALSACQGYTLTWRVLKKESGIKSGA
jgi:hypothetical protein